jgi:hypothetical protein
MSSAEDFSKAIDITKQLGTHAKTMIKPKDIPIYGQEIKVKKDKDFSEPGILLTTVKEARIAVQDSYHQVQDIVSPIKDSTVNVIQTGKAHAQATYQMIHDEQDSTVNAVVIGGSGLLGFALGSFFKRARFFKRLVLTTVSAGLASYIIYPSETEGIATSLADETTRLGLIAYNFIQGVQPNESAKNLTATSHTTVNKQLNVSNVPSVLKTYSI